MPSALTMLMCYEDQLEGAREAGLARMGERARLAIRIRALVELVNGDFDRRWEDPPTARERLRPAA
jgi:hypothetical protein